MSVESPYPRPDPPAFRSVHPRTLAPSQSPPAAPHLPALPSPPRKPMFSFAGHGEWVLTTHIVPAAYPRTLPYVEPFFAPPPRHDKSARTQWTQDTADALIRLHNEKQNGASATLGSSIASDPLWCVANRYVKTNVKASGRARVTLFLAHANSFHKETWEPTLSHLLSPTGGTDAYELIDEVWSWESVQHGDAALLNEGRLGCVFDWSDNARDIIHFLTHYLPSPLQPDAYYSATLPTHLPRLPAATARARTTTGLGPEGRKLVAIGHSFGGCSLVLAAAAHGTLFERLVLIDAVVMMPRVYDVYPFVTGALKRRARWSGRDEARAQLVAKPFFAQWHPAALDVYVECGMTMDDQAENGGGGGSIPSRGLSQPVKLKMSPLQEAVVFAEALATFEGWERIAEISPDVELRWVMPGETSMGGLQAVKERVWRRPANSSHVIIPTAGHLIVQETPKELAHEIGSFLVQRYGGDASLKRFRSYL